MTTATDLRMADLVHRVGQLPPMPKVAGRVLSLLDSPSATSEKLQQIIETDPALTASVLRLVNSAMFSLPGRITTLSHAITLIGFLRLRSLTIATVVAGLKRMISERAALRRDQIWEHSVGVGLAARELATRKGYAWIEEAFLAGLLHDCGRLVLLSCMTDEYMDLMSGSRLPSVADERDAFGLDHQQVGAALLSEWRLSDELVGACAAHHGDEGLAGPRAELMAVVMLADRIVPDEPPEDPSKPAQRLGFKPSAVPELAELIRARVIEMRAELLAL